ncbi:hypothetical protein C7S17_2723 [Burkholderia thailandensis]|nr:hypothetical protein [Burkholderia thailandensis]
MAKLARADRRPLRALPARPARRYAHKKNTKGLTKGSHFKKSAIPRQWT